MLYAGFIGKFLLLFFIFILIFKQIDLLKLFLK